MAKIISPICPLKLQSIPNKANHQKTNNFQFNHFYNNKPLAIPPFGLIRIKEAMQQINQKRNQYFTTHNEQFTIHGQLTNFI